MIYVQVVVSGVDLYIMHKYIQNSWFLPLDPSSRGCLRYLSSFILIVYQMILFSFSFPESYTCLHPRDTIGKFSII